MFLPICPILAVSYSNEHRALLTDVLRSIGVQALDCSTFSEAEDHAIKDMYSGMLVDLQTIIKAKDEEKYIAHTLTNFLPTLRVRPAALAGENALPDSPQLNNIFSFLKNNCTAYTPRKLRQFRRHSIIVNTLIKYHGEQLRGFTLDISWGGTFIVDMMADRHTTEEPLNIIIPEYQCEIPLIVKAVKPWGIANSAPGIGLSFTSLDEITESVIARIIKTKIDSDRDRLTS